MQIGSAHGFHEKGTKHLSQCKTAQLKLEKDFTGIQSQSKLNSLHA